MKKIKTKQYIFDTFDKTGSNDIIVTAPHETARFISRNVLTNKTIVNLFTN